MYSIVKSQIHLELLLERMKWNIPLYVVHIALNWLTILNEAIKSNFIEFSMDILRSVVYSSKEQCIAN